MNLLFVTRKIDKDDARVGFVHDWINAFSANLDTLHVVCQEKGNTSGLSKNVQIHSFGKEHGYGRLRQLFTFYLLLFTLAKKSQGIFCHMHPIYVIVSWLPAKLFGNKLALWYMHRSVDLKLRIAEKLADIIFTGTKESFRLPTKKLHIVGHGIPIERFNAKNTKKDTKNAKGEKGGSRFSHGFRGFRIISIGRISRVKDYETLIKAIQILTKSPSPNPHPFPPGEGGTEGGSSGERSSFQSPVASRQTAVNLTVDIYGEPALKTDEVYFKSLKQFVVSANLSDYVTFHGGVPYEQVPALNAEADLFVNMSQTGSLDKAVLEAGAVKTIAMSSNEAFVEPLSNISPLLVFERNNPRDLAEKISQIIELPEKEKNRIRDELFQWVSKNHSLKSLVSKILSHF